MEPMEGEIIDLNRANMLHSQISCVHVARHTQTCLKHKWDSFFILKDRQDRHVFMCEQQRKCWVSYTAWVHRSTSCLLSGSGVSQSARLNINDSMQIKMSLFQWSQRQGQRVGGQINLFNTHSPYKPLSDCLVRRLPWNAQQAPAGWMNCRWKGSTHHWQVCSCSEGYWLVFILPSSYMIVVRVYLNLHLIWTWLWKHGDLILSFTPSCVPW